MQITNTIIAILANIAIIAGAITTIIIYRLNKSNERKVAFTILLDQINLIEERIKNLDELEIDNKMSLYKTPVIIKDNTWEKNKVIFVKYLKNHDCKSIQSFFDDAELIENTRKDIINVTKNVWLDKQTVMQNEIGRVIFKTIDKNENNINNEISKIISCKMQEFYKADGSFNAYLTRDAMISLIRKFNRLSDTPAYEKIHKQSFYKN